MEFHQQFELPSVVCIFQILPIDCHGQRLLLPLESFVDNVCSVSSLVWGKYVSSFKVLSKLPGHNPFHQLSRGVLHFEDMVSVQLAMVLSRFWD